MRQLSVGVLAGGKNTGGHLNDALYQLNNERYMKRLIKEFGVFSEMLISDAKTGRYEKLGQRVVYDEHGDIGPIEGVCQIIKHTSDRYVFVCAVDMPFISRKLVEYMADFICGEYDCYVLADEERLYPLCAIYSKEVLSVIESLIASGHYRLTDIFHRTRTRFIRLPETGFERKIVRNLYVRQKPVLVWISECFLNAGMSEQEKCFLIIRMINGYIRGINTQKNQYGMEM